MSSPLLSYQTTGTLPTLVREVMDENPLLKPFYKAPATIDYFASQILDKTAQYPEHHRAILAQSLHAQYQHIQPNATTTTQINALKKPTTFTVTTGHQLNLMGGPLYFLYKIISVINLTKILKEKYPKYNFIPVFWMATEDHDFAEINHFYFGEHRLEWQRQSQGPVGRLSTKGLEVVLDQFSALLGHDLHSNELKHKFEQAYLKSDNLADATRVLVHQMFGDDGLIIVDGDDANLKRLLIPTLKDELCNRIVFNQVTATNQALNTIDGAFKIQVNPRPLNLFYINDNLRERFEERAGVFRVLNSDKVWDLEGILNELENHPERFSPNVLMRPLYQETILPNLCYVGGGGELSYWLQLKSLFDQCKIDFPLLMHRNSAVIISKHQQDKLHKANLSVGDIFLSSEELSTKIAKSQTDLIDFKALKHHLNQQFKSLHDIVEQTDASFLGAVSAQEQKQINGLINLEKRLLKAEKRKHKTQINKALALKGILFPEGYLQERRFNFSTFYKDYSENFIQILKSELDPFQQGFTIISL